MSEPCNHPRFSHINILLPTLRGTGQKIMLPKAALSGKAMFFGNWQLLKHQRWTEHILLLTECVEEKVEERLPKHSCNLFRASGLLMM